jgi:hypothetical protein
MAKTFSVFVDTARAMNNVMHDFNANAVDQQLNVYGLYQPSGLMSLHVLDDVTASQIRSVFNNIKGVNRVAIVDDKTLDPQIVNHVDAKIAIGLICSLAKE